LDSFSGATYAPLLIALAVPFTALALLGPKHKVARMLASVTCVVCGLRYIWWRWTMSMPVGQEPWQQAWAWIFLIFESLTVISSLTVYCFMGRTRNRSREVDARIGSPLLNAPVDVFIATYNEDHDILERTLVGATSIDHADLRVWVLDDGNRAWVRDLAAEFGAQYISRVKGKHAKAGNVNNGLRAALATGRRPRFILLLDADFVAARHILKRTLPLFEEDDVGIVQTPQHFFNPDPIQSNLLCTSAWPDEQRFFFNYLLESKDAWGAAFCCGTSAVFRVEALERCGGMPTATVTEDMLTTFRMEEEGFRTVFLNEQLSLGLAPEGIREYVSQRSRWCLGAIQQCYTRWGFAGRGRLSLISRFSAFDGVLFWGASFSFKLMMISAPMIYWWTGTAVIVSSVDDMLLWLGPYMLSGMVFMGFLARNTVFPIMTDVTHLLAAPAIVRTVATAVVKPWGHPFKVTAKGVSTDGPTVQWGFLAPFAFMVVGTLLGMLRNMSPYSALNGTPGYTINVFWSLFNIAVLAIACAVCVELPRRRRDERFISGEAAVAVFGEDGGSCHCQVLNVSIGGARLAAERGWSGVPPRGELLLDGGALRLPFERLGSTEDSVLTVRFILGTRVRRALIRKLFTGAYNNEVDHVRVAGTLIGAARKVFS
jgi:cellulose synthase (UDP-forming)